MAIAFDRRIFLETGAAADDCMAEGRNSLRVGSNQTDLVVFVEGDAAYSGKRRRMKRRWGRSWLLNGVEHGLGRCWLWSWTMWVVLSQRSWYWLRCCSIWCGRGIS